tara:strand:- start:845 stop:2377 length:1533 start_codon:yes stop_codon:yes gene_type:complete
MKLIRLTTRTETDIVGNTQAYFDAIFNDDLEIAADSQIALDNISLENDNTTLIIDTSNNVIRYQISKNFNRNIELELGTFGKNNYTDLLDDITKKLNENAGYYFVNGIIGAFDTRELGIEWDSGVDRGNKIYIQYKISRQAEYEDKWVYDKAVLETKTIANRKIWSMMDLLPGNTNDLTKSALFPDYISKGCGYIRARIHKIARTVTTGTGQEKKQGFMIGLSRTDLSALSPDQMTSAQVDYGLRVTYDDAGAIRYVIQKQNVYTIEQTERPTYVAEGDLTNDFMELSVDGGTLLIMCHHNANAGIPSILETIQLDTTQPLYPFISFFGDKASAQLNNLRVTPSPFSGVVMDQLGITTTDTLYAPPIYRGIKGDNFLDFQSVAVSTFLGFINPRIPLTGVINDGELTYTADSSFDPVDLADAFLVELINLPVDSYDSYTNQRKNLLAVIPKSNENGSIIYEPQTLKFIDLKNKNAQLLRNIRCRVVKNDYTPLALRGFGTITILIKQKGE